MNVFVTGGTGYAGVPVVTRLRDAGHQVYVLQRLNTDRPLSIPGIEVVVGDLFEPNAWASALSQCNALVHMVGIIRERPREGVTMQHIHVDGTATALAAATRAGIQRVIHLSALGARPGAVSRYHRSKYEAELLVRQSGMIYTTFQPSVMFGQGGPGPEFVGMLTQLVKTSPIVPMIGDGHFELQPVAVQTLADAIVSALECPVAYNKTYELGGPGRISYREILHLIANRMGKRLKTIRIPVSLMKSIVKVMQDVQSFPLTMDQLTMLLEGNVCSDTETVYRDLSPAVIPFEVLA